MFRLVPFLLAGWCLALSISQEEILNRGETQSKIYIPIAPRSIPISKLPAKVALQGRKRGLLHSNARQYMHAVDIQLGGYDVKLYLDTGSSNIWLIEKGFQCIEIGGDPIDNADCKFVNPGFDPAEAAGSKIEPSWFNTGYAGGEYMIGYGWTSDVSFNGVTVNNQPFGVVTKAHWAGDGYTSGLLGMGSLYTNQIYRNDSISSSPGDDNRLVVGNPYTLAWEQGLSSEYHSLALNRVPFDEEHDGTQPAGYLAFGGVPSEVSVTSNQVTVPVITWTLRAVGAQINEQAWSVPDTKSTFTFPGSNQIVQNPVTPNMDTGSAGVGLPTPVFKAYTAQIKSYACDGSGLPELAWHVNGVDISFDRRDLLGYNGPDNCFLDVYDSGPDDAALGPNFAQSAVFVWNKAKGEVTIMERAPY